MLDHARAAEAPSTLESARLRTLQRRYTWIVIVTPFIAFVVAMATLWGPGAGLVALSMLAVMYALTSVGICVGFHRYFTHRSFECVPSVRWILAALGSMAAEGPLIYWVATHRFHHQESDLSRDPHSPHSYGAGLRDVVRGLWHAHVGWMFTSPPANALRYAPDLLNDPLASKAHERYVVWVLLGLALPAALGGLLTASWTGVWQGLLWGGFARVFLVQHVTWSVNSICHVYGRQPYATGDQSRNNKWLALLSFGESWHNNHHAFPSSAWHGLESHELDISGWIIQRLASFGLAWDVVLPPPTLMERKRAVTFVGRSGRPSDEPARW